MSQAIPKARRISSYVVVTFDDFILLSKLNHGPAEGKWNLIGGGIQHGEDPIHAAVREMKEEAGLTVDASELRLLNVLSEHVTHQVRNSKHAPERNGQLEDFHLIGIIYLVRFNEKPNCKMDGDGDSSDGCRWFSFQEIEQSLKTEAAGEQFVTFVPACVRVISKPET